MIGKRKREGKKYNFFEMARYLYVKQLRNKHVRHLNEQRYKSNTQKVFFSNLLWVEIHQQFVVQSNTHGYTNLVESDYGNSNSKIIIS